MEKDLLRTENASVLDAPLGRHIIVELFTDDIEFLKSEERIMKALEKAAEAGNVTVVGRTSTTFNPHGVTAVLLLAESHLSIHTWPEYGYAAVDIFTCGGNPEAVLDELMKQANARKYDVVQDIDRGKF